MSFHTKIKWTTIITVATALVGLVVWIALREIGRIDIVEAQQMNVAGTLGEMKGTLETVKIDVQLIKGKLIK